MAKMVINAELDRYMQALEKFATDEPKIAEEVVNAGAQPVADEIRSKLSSLPEDKFRMLNKDEMFVGVPMVQKKDLLDSLGITPASVSNEGNTNVKVGFDGYGSYPTRKYKKGVPNALLARSVESGSSVRKKTPFVRPAVNKSRDAAIAEMDKAINEAIKIYAL